MVFSSIFAAVGAWLANGPGILFLSILAASLVLVWDWRWTLGGTTVVMVGISSLAAALHGPVPAVTGAQWMTALVSSLLLGLSAYFHRPGVVVAHHGNWLLRSIALGFLAGAWWVLDPGVAFPTFTRVETDLLIWIGLCGALMLGLSAAPFYNGIGLLLLTSVAQNLATVLLPGSGLPVLIGIAQILLALGCAYLVLVQPAQVSRWQAISTGNSSTQKREERGEPVPGPRPPRLFPGRAAQPGPLARSKEPVESLNTASSSVSPSISAEEGI